ncbi:MAG TPA: SGNH/GDSL hydrolase family protein [Candidatus Limnocylindria bacterium]
MAALVTACAGPAPDPEPWERPVDGSAGVTEWDDGGTPSSPFGPDGADWSSAEQLVEAVAASLQQSGAEVEHAIVPGDEPDLVTGWLRLTDPADRVTLAVDLRLRIERDGDAWSVTGVEERRHCRHRPKNDRCREPGRPDPVETTEPAESSTAVGAGVYLALGDSLTFGIGVPRPQDNGFVARVAAALADANPPVAESRILAVPGETAAGFRDRRLDDTVAAIEELGPRVRLVSVGLGANEVLRVRREPACESAPDGDPCRALVDAAIAEAAGALDTVLDVVRDALASNGSTAPVIVLAYYVPDPAPGAAEPIVGSDGTVSCDPAETRPGLNDRIACVAEARSAALVDLHAAFRGRESELTRIADGDVHPNAAGYEIIAESILDVLEEP